MIPNRAIVYAAVEIRFAYLGIRSANLLAATRSAGERQPIRSIWKWMTPYLVARCALRYLHASVLLSAASGGTSWWPLYLE